LDPSIEIHNNNLEIRVLRISHAAGIGAPYGRESISINARLSGTVVGIRTAAPLKG